MSIQRSISYNIYRAIRRSKNRPVLRTNSKIYKKGGQQETEMTPERVIEDHLKPPSLPTARKQQPPSQTKQPVKCPQIQLKKGPIAPPPKPNHGNLYTHQSQDTGPIDSEFEDSYEDFSEPEETYETMFSTEDNVAYKNRHIQRPKPPPQKNNNNKQLPEEFYDYLPS